MTKKRIYLHVGTPKTGTTTIQHFLTSNRDVLARQGTAVYTALETDPADCMRLEGCLDPSYAGDNGENWTRELIRRIQSRPEEKIILSEEMCWFGIVLLEKRTQFLAFIEQLQVIADVTLIVYLRRQDHFLMSSYREHLKTGWLDGRTCRQQLKAMDHQFLDYRENLEWLNSAAGGCRLTVRPFETGQLFQNSLIHDFMHCTDVLITEEFAGFDRVRNAGMSPFLTEIMRCLSFFRYTRPELSVFWSPEALKDRRCYNGQTDESPALSPRDRCIYLQRFDEGNRWVASELLGRNDGVLFEEPLLHENSSWVEYKLNPDEVRDFFKQASFLTSAQRRKMCRQVLSVCDGGRPVSLRLCDAVGKFKTVPPDCFSEWLNSPLPTPPTACSEVPLFSIIMPVRNREKDVLRSLKSIQLQDFTDVEVIIVDDASTDGTAGEVSWLAKSDPRIKLIRLEENIGPGPARNVGIQQARGKYIRVCDSDDFYPPGSLSAFARRIAEEESDLIAGNLICWHSRERKIKPHSGPWQIDRIVRSQDLRQLPELWAMVHFHRCAFRREFLLENHIEYPAMRRGEDPVYMATILSKARSFSLIPEEVYLFHERSRNQQFPYEHIRDAVAAHGQIRQIMSEAGYPELGFFFDCYYPPFSLSHDALTDEESVRISTQLIDFANHFPVEMLENPYLDHPACDKVALYHDLLVAQNQSPEQVAEWMRRRMFCGQEHLRQNEIEKLRQTVRALNRQLNPFRPFLRIYRGLKRRIVRRAVV